MEGLLDLLAQDTHWWAFGLLLACGMGLPPWSEELVLLGTGTFVAQGSLSFTSAVIWCLAGILAGDSIIWGAGRRWGDRAYDAPLIRRHLGRDNGRRARFKRRFDRHADWAIFLARFFPGYRMLAYLVGGIQRFPYWKFLLLDAAGAVLTGPISIWMGWKFAENLDLARIWIHRFQIPLMIAAALVVGLLIWRALNRRRHRYKRLRAERRARSGHAGMTRSAHLPPAGRPGPRGADGSHPHG